MNASDPRHEWMQQYADGTASAETVAQLEAALCEDPEFRALFLEYLYLDSALSAETTARNAAAENVIPMRKVPQSPARWLAFAAVLLATLAAAIWMLVPGTSSKTVASIRRSVAAEWEGAAPKAGESLKPGWLRLKSGAAQVDFARGARVVLEGPAEFQLVSDNEGRLQSGKARAIVPPSARGFTVRGEGFTAVDHGTEFGVMAGAKPEVHVFAGSVSVRGDTEHILTTNEAARVSPSIIQAIPAQPENFLSEPRLASLETSAGLKSHPSAMAFYDFETVAPVQANGVAGREIPAAASGTWTEGRWPGSKALRFGRSQDRARFTVPGEMRSITLLAWARVDALHNTQSSLLMSEAELPGDVHWYLHSGGVLGFAVIGQDHRWKGAQTPVVLRRENFGKWNFFAVTFDGETGVATHYLNGRMVSSHPLAPGGPLRLRTAEIGNWGKTAGMELRASKRVAIEPAGFTRTLHGSVDEFAILSTPLSAPEILHLYETGRPPQE